ncbi:MAG: diguanylate cyclase [Candidatus Eremiobacteraeota bacterium]|nr:diguanylate cyclase [Candidatus Eremiobacteraeota bacterium]
MLRPPSVFSGEQDEGELLGYMCSLVMRDRHYQMASIAAVEPDGTLRTICQSGIGSNLQDDAVQIALRTDEPVAAQTTAAIPFTVAGAPLIFVAQASVDGVFTRVELDVLDELCAVFAQTIMNIRTREARVTAERDRANHAEQRISALWKIANRTLGINYDANLIARDILLEGREQLELQWGFIGRIEGDHLQLELLSEERRPSSTLSPHPFERARLLLDKHITGDTFTSQNTRTYMRAAQATRFTSSSGEEMTLTIQAFAGTPFRVSGTWYLLCFGSDIPRDDDFSQQDKRYVELLASVFSRTLEQRATLQQIEYLQDHDALTRLPHRNRFHVRLSELLQKANRLEPIAVLIVDTDRYRQLIDEFGPEAGDEIVLELAQRIRLAKNEQHELFRYRSDSFAMIVHGPKALTDVHFLADRCIAAIGTPMKINGEDARLRANIGISIYPSDGEDVPSLTIAPLQRCAAPNVPDPLSSGFIMNYLTNASDGGASLPKSCARR